MKIINASASGVARNIRQHHIIIFNESNNNRLHRLPNLPNVARKYFVNVLPFRRIVMASWHPAKMSAKRWHLASSLATAASAQ